MDQENKQRIMNELIMHVKKYDIDYKQWYAGISFDPEKRKKDHERITDVKHFRYWDIETKKEAKALEATLHKLGFKEGKADLTQKTLEGLREDSKYVYVYLNK